MNSQNENRMQSSQFKKPHEKASTMVDSCNFKSNNFIKIFNKQVALPIVQSIQSTNFTNNKNNSQQVSASVYCNSSMKIVPPGKSGVFRSKDSKCTYPILNETVKDTSSCTNNNKNIILIDAVQTEGCIVPIEKYSKIYQPTMNTESPQTIDSTQHAMKLDSNEKTVISEQHDGKSETMQIYEIVRPFDAGLQSSHIPTIKENTLSRKRKRSTILGTEKTTKPNEISKLLATSRTRSGRVSRPPTYMTKFINQIYDGKLETEGTAANNLSIKKHYSSSSSSSVRVHDVEKTQSISEPKLKRTIPDCYKCSTCNKIYLGDNKRKQHLKAFPDHVMPDYDNELNGESTFDFLMKKVNGYPINQQQFTFFHELSDFIAKCLAIRSKLLTSSCGVSGTQYFDKNVSKMFGIQEGSYNINIAAVLNEYNENKKIDKMCLPPPLPSTSPPPPPPLLKQPPLTTSLISRSSSDGWTKTNEFDVLVNGGGSAAGSISNESLFDTVHDIDLCDDASHMLGLRKNALTFNDISDNAVEKSVTLSPQLDFSNLINGST